jgi:hypothetical protein
MSFESFLTALMSPQNGARAAAEQKYNEMKAADPGPLVGHLMAVLAQPAPDPTLRAFSAVLLRGLIGRRATVYFSLPAQTQAQLRSGLLAVATENASNKLLSKRVCDTIGELGIVVEANGHWAELLPWALQQINTPNPDICEVGLTVLAQVALVLASRPQYHQHYPNLCMLLQRCMTAPGAGVGVRVAAVQVTCNLVVCITSSEQRAAFRPLVPSMLIALADVLTRDNTTLKSAEMLECFGDVSYEHGSFYRLHLAQVHAAMLQIAGSTQLDDKLRRFAVEWIAATAEGSGSMCRKLANNAYTRNTLPVLLSMMLADVDSMVGDLAAWEKRGETAGAGGGTVGDDSDITNFDVALSGIERIGRAIGAKRFVPTLFEILGQYMTNPDWRCRFVALMVVGCSAETMPSEYLDPMIQQLTPFFNAQASEGADPRVRCAACDVVGELSLEGAHAHVFQAGHHAVVIPILHTLLSDPSSPRVQSRAAAALIVFLEACEEEYVLPHLQGLLTVLFERLQRGQRVVKEQAVTAIASLAEVASRNFGAMIDEDDEDEFGIREQLRMQAQQQNGGAITSPLAQYYPHIMPTLKQILQTCSSKDDRLLRARALECATLFGVAVDKAQFHDDAVQIMQFMMHQQKSGLSFDDPLRSYMLQGWARIGRSFGAEFSQYLNMIMPSLLEAASVEAEKTVDEDTASKLEQDMGEEEEGGNSKYMVNMGDRIVQVHTSALDEKTTAMQMLGTMAHEMKAVFAPYVASVISIVGPLTLISGTVHDELRSAAIATMPSLIDAVNATGNKQGVSQLFQHIQSRLLVAIDEEYDMDVLKTAAQSLKESVLAACRPAGVTQESDDFSNAVPMLDASGLSSIFGMLVKSMRASLQRRAVRIAERKVAEDYDEEDMEMEELANEAEAELLYILHESIGAVIKTHGNSFLPSFQAEVMPLMQQMAQKGGLSSDRKIVVYIFDDVVEFGGEQVQRDLMPQIFPSFLSSTKPEEEASLRQGCAYGIGVCATQGGQHFAPYVPHAAKALVDCISHPEATGPANSAATDNCISSLGKVCSYHAGTLPNCRAILLQVSRSKNDPYDLSVAVQTGHHQDRPRVCASQRRHAEFRVWVGSTEFTMFVVLCVFLGPRLKCPSVFSRVAFSPHLFNPLPPPPPSRPLLVLVFFIAFFGKTSVEGR